MRIKPARKSKVLLELGPGESRFLSAEDSQAGRGVQFRRILVPIDFSESSRQALNYAAELGRQFHSELIGVHVIEVSYGMGEMGYVIDADILRGKMRQETERQLSEWLSDLKYEPASSSVRTGIPYDEIVRAAEEEGADLVVLGSHGRSGLSHFFLGSTSERVVRHAPCPVMVIRPSATPRKKARSARGVKKRGEKRKTVFV